MLCGYFQTILTSYSSITFLYAVHGAVKMVTLTFMLGFYPDQMEFLTFMMVPPTPTPPQKKNQNKHKVFQQALVLFLYSSDFVTNGVISYYAYKSS
jgi:hypothetical protein